MEYVYLLMLVGLVIALCIFINRITDKLKVPSLLLFIGLGMVFGVAFRVAGLGNFTDYDLGNVVCSICLVFVIFYGGFGTNFKEARPVAGRALLLSFAGTALTAGIVGVFVYFLSSILPFFPSLGWAESMLIGSVISSTDAASVFNILRSRRLNLKYGTSSLLEMESGSNDPTSYMLTVVFTAVLAAQNGIVGATSMGAGEIVGMLFSQVGFGAIFGAAFGFLAILILKKFSFNMGQGGTIFILAIGLMTYALPSVLGELTGVSALAGNGYLAVYLAGIIIGNKSIPYRKDILSFFDGMTWLVQIFMFLILGLLVNPHEMLKTGPVALLIGIFMILVARPLSVFISLAPFRKISTASKSFISWVGLRGAAPILFATYPVVENVEGADLIFNIVFFITLLSLVIQGSSITGSARLLKLNEDMPEEENTFGVEVPEEAGKLAEITLTEESLLHGNTLKELKLPEGMLVMMIKREDKFIVPNGSVELRAGDRLLIISDHENNS